MSLLLFLVVMDRLIIIIIIKHIPTELEHIFHDIALIVNILKKIHLLMNVWTQDKELRKRKVNVDKGKVIIIERQTTEEATIILYKQQKFEVVSTFKYLGSIIRNYRKLDM